MDSEGADDLRSLNDRYPEDTVFHPSALHRFQVFLLHSRTPMYLDLSLKRKTLEILSLLYH